MKETIAMHDDWTAMLSDYIDDGLSAEDRARVDEHLADCAVCRQTLTELQTVVERARSFAGTAHPPEHVWQRISATVQRPQRARRLLAGITAAAAVIALGFFALPWMRTRSTPPLSAPASPTSRTTATMDLSHYLEQHASSIPRSVALNLATQQAAIDTAIAEVRRSFAGNAPNADVSRRLIEYEELRFDLLRSAVAAVQRSNPS